MDQNTLFADTTAQKGTEMVQIQWRYFEALKFPHECPWLVKGLQNSFFYGNSKSFNF